VEAAKQKKLGGECGQLKERVCGSEGVLTKTNSRRDCHIVLSNGVSPFTLM